MKRHCLLAPWFFTLHLLGGVAQAVPAEVGGMTFELPAPQHFHRIDGLCPAYDEVQMAANGPKLKMLGQFGTADDLYEIRTEGWPTTDRLFWAQVGSDLQHDRLDPERFREIADGIEQEHGRKNKPLTRDTGQTERAINRHLSTKTGVPTRVELGKMHSLGCYDRGGNYVCFAVLMHPRTIMPDGSVVETGPLYVAASITLIGDKAVFLYCQSYLRSEEDGAWARAQLAQWREQIFAANPGLVVEVPGRREPTAAGWLVIVGAPALFLWGSIALLRKVG